MIPIPWASLLFNRFTAGALAVALAAASYSMHRQSLIQSGYDQAMKQVADRENERLREQIRETARLVALVKGLDDETEQQRQDLDAFRARERDAAERMRAAQADFDRRLATASAEAVRRYASATDGNLERCRADLARFAAEAVTGSRAAHTLKSYMDASP